MTKHHAMTLGKRTIRYLRYGSGEPLVFLQGFGIKPHYYTPLLKKLGDRFEVFAPDILRGSTMRAQPRTLADHADLIADFTACLGIGPHGIVGHSMGGGMACVLGARSPTTITRIVALNPLMPVEFGFSGFLLRSLRKGVHETTGRHGGMKAIAFASRFHGPFLGNSLRGILRVHRLVNDVCDFSYDALDVQQPALILFADQDEYFKLTPAAEETLHHAFRAVTVERLPGWNHDWPLFYPTRAADAIHTFFTPS